MLKNDCLIRSITGMYVIGGPLRHVKLVFHLLSAPSRLCSQYLLNLQYHILHYSNSTTYSSSTAPPNFAVKFTFTKSLIVVQSPDFCSIIFSCPLHRSQVPLLKLLVIFIGFILVTQFCIRFCRLSFRPTTNFNAYMCTIVNEIHSCGKYWCRLLV